MITVHRLEGLYWVARTGGYSKAARAFPYPISQAGVHHQVRKLEGELGVRLFERVGRDDMRLTAAGVVLYELAARFFDELPQVISSLRAHSYGGALRIHASRQLIAHLLPPWLAALRRARPDITPVVAELHAQPLDLLRGHDTDLIVEHLAAVPNDIASRRVGKIVGRAIVPNSEKKPFRLDRLSHLPMVAYPECSPEWVVQRRALDVLGLEPAIAAYAPDATSLLALVAAGLGFSLVPLVEGMQTRATAHRGVRVVASRTVRFEFPVFALWRKSTVPQPLVDAALRVAPAA
jgi:DNA-binding transcriptional LysR family regulator